MLQPLTIYRASAGSGKTFRLAVEYIKLLIQNPMSYRNILAVTFTNKATEEMKMRILGQLYGLANGLDTSSDYLKAIMKDTSFDEKTIRDKSRIALTLILHNYQYFRVETIDSFFQSVLRNLARELGLNANLRVELNDKQVEEESVDQMIESLEAHDKVLSWIMDFIHQNMADDKSWNVINELKSFGMNIFKDDFKDNKKEMDQQFAQKDFFKNIYQRLNDIRTEAEKHFKDIAQTFYEIEEQYGLTVDDFNYKGSGAWTYFKKLDNGVYTDSELLGKRFLTACENPQTWLKDKGLIEAGEKLTELANKSEKTRKQYSKLYYSALFTMQNLYKIRLLRYIDDSVNQKNKELNRFLLSNTQTLLAGMIDESDSPFIYEKIGTQIQHIMIDEFQDTSRTQWKNFKVLLNESMAKAPKVQDGISENLIVGDVKQSIYRWRNGDWKLLNNIEDEFNKNELNSQSMGVNYRSSRNVVEFNNSFFEFANLAEAKRLEEEVGQLEQTVSEDEKKQLAVQAKEITKAYESLRQEVPDSKPREGYVDIRLIPEKTNDESISYDDQILEMLKDTIDSLINEQHVDMKDIAILSRSRSDISHIVDYFMGLPDNHIKMVSDEAYQLQASPAVNLIITAMRVISNPKDVYYVALLTHLYQSFRHGNQQDLINMAMPVVKDKDSYLNHFISLLPKGFYDEIASIGALPLIDMAEKIKTMFNLTAWNSQAAYLCYFSDQLSNYVENNAGSVDDFLRLWDENLSTKSISGSESNGIRLLTIHQSKGLEFKYVIIPYCDWTLERYEDTLWTTPSEKPYSELVKVPVKFQKKLLESIYAYDYETEHQQIIVDNLNLLYVAFTRAKKGLYVMGKRKPEKKKTDDEDKWNCRSYIIEDYLTQEKANLPKGTFVDFPDGELHFKMGHPIEETKNQEVKAEQPTANVFERKPEPQNVLVESSHHAVVFLQSNQSRRFIEGEIDEGKKEAEFIDLGNVLHELFSTIATMDEVEPKLDEFEFNGIIDSKVVPRKKVLDSVRKAFENPDVQEWFKPGLTLMNECNILSIDPVTGVQHTDRPDRVMIDGQKATVVDFKFATPIEDHVWQVRRYMNLLRKMGYTDVKGYLWYVFRDEIKPVTTF
ncbi:MAG: UvrD-helicase domain-containing protein [Prevotella sp.]|jgi:ATP-dependent exoDNAse (exonuclease V) beta subunit